MSQDLQVALNMQSANKIASKRDNVVHRMQHASLHRQAMRGEIHFLDFLQIGP